MAFPRTLNDMIPSGYQFDNHAECRGCGNDIEWWITPSGKKIPMNPMSAGSDSATAHLSTCTEARLIQEARLMHSLRPYQLDAYPGPRKPTIRASIGNWPSSLPDLARPR